MVGVGQSSSMVTSSPAALPAVPNMSLLQPGMLSAGLMPGRHDTCLPVASSLLN